MRQPRNAREISEAAQLSRTNHDFVVTGLTAPDIAGYLLIAQNYAIGQQTTNRAMRLGTFNGLSNTTIFDFQLALRQESYTRLKNIITRNSRAF